MTIYTIGHSTRTQQELLEILKNWGIACLIDIRSFPGSRKFPHFNRETLGAALAQQGVKYIHFKPLGGLRKKPMADSPNTAWENESFRNYADYMLTPEFDNALNDLIKIASESKTLIMCAEAVPWRCHRQLIGDALVSLKGVNVLHILAANKVQPHAMTRFAKVKDQRLTYPGKTAGKQAGKTPQKPAEPSKPAETPAATASPAAVATPEPAAAATAEPGAQTAPQPEPTPEPTPPPAAASEPVPAPDPAPTPEPSPVPQDATAEANVDAAKEPHE